MVASWWFNGDLRIKHQDLVVLMIVNVLLDIYGLGMLFGIYLMDVHISL